MNGRRPVTVAMREADRNPGHTNVYVWAGRNPGARAHAGLLTFRTDEWDELTDDAARDPDGTITLTFDVLPPGRRRPVNGRTEFVIQHRNPQMYSGWRDLQIEDDLGEARAELKQWQGVISPHNLQLLERTTVTIERVLEEHHHE